MTSTAAPRVPRRGEITCGVRISTRPHVTVDKPYRMEEGEIEVDSITPIGLPDITHNAEASADTSAEQMLSIQRR